MYIWSSVFGIKSSKCIFISCKRWNVKKTIFVHNIFEVNCLCLLCMCTCTNTCLHAWQFNRTFGSPGEEKVHLKALMSLAMKRWLSLFLLSDLSWDHKCQKFSYSQPVFPASLNQVNKLIVREVCFRGSRKRLAVKEFCATLVCPSLLYPAVASSVWLCVCVQNKTPCTIVSVSASKPFQVWMCAFRCVVLSLYKIVCVCVCVCVSYSALPLLFSPRRLSTWHSLSPSWQSLWHLICLCPCFCVRTHTQPSSHCHLPLCAIAVGRPNVTYLFIALGFQ